MGHRGLITTLLIATGLAIFIATGCGGGSSSSSSEASSGTDSTAASGAESGKSGESAKGKSGETSKSAADNEFIVPGGKNEVAEFGTEASDSEREAASVVLEENLHARSTKDFAAQCASLAAPVVATIEKNNNGQSCTQTLEKEGSKAPKEILENTLEGPIDVLRVKAPKAYALWHGSGGKNYAMAMEEENGQWKVAAVITTVLPTAAEAKAKPKAESAPKTKSP